jgi:hypothetical protein
MKLSKWMLVLWVIVTVWLGAGLYQQVRINQRLGERYQTLLRRTQNPPPQQLGMHNGVEHRLKLAK